jgi:hypothetical protein
MRARRRIAPRYIDRLDLLKKDLRTFLATFGFPQKKPKKSRSEIGNFTKEFWSG